MTEQWFYYVHSPGLDVKVPQIQNDALKEVVALSGKQAGVILVSV